MKQIWSGTWSSGSITVSELPYYNVFRVIINNVWNTYMSVICTRSVGGSGEKYLSGGLPYPDNTDSIGWVLFRAEVSGTAETTITGTINNSIGNKRPADYYYNRINGSLGADREYSVVSIYGLL